MKRRITYIQRSDAGFDPEQAVVTPKSLTIRNLVAAREDRLTFELNDLSSELRDLLHKSKDVHVRWATEESFDAVPPFASRVSPGLHVLHTPLDADQSSETFCSWLGAAFGRNENEEALDCSQHENTFIESPHRTTDSHAATSLQYHTQLPSLKPFISNIKRAICGPHTTESAQCIAVADSLSTADVVDVDYDGTSNTLVLSGFWANGPTGGWSEEIHKPTQKSDKVEFGLLGAEPGIGADEVKVGGLLAVVGEDKKLKPTMFSFPSRHHVLPQSASYAISFSEPTGLHPTMSITIPRSSLNRPSAPDDTTCSLHTYLTLPSSIFGDQYQLGTSDSLFLQSHNLAGLRAHSGETDLEAPDWAVKGWGSNWLFELATPTDDDLASQSSNWTSTIPLHLRYLHPSDTGYRPVHVPWPVVFWACSSEYEEESIGINPFDRTHLGYDSLFSPRTFFYQLHPQSEHLVEKLDAPVLNLGDGQGFFQTHNIELGTSIVISLGFFWVLWQLARVAWSSGLGANNTAQQVEVHDKKD
ncbi:hypothetical protein N7456_011425 [Penicillium angulare]|uniref:Protein PBN1 n=1 Tax=Penicillium angulare TaxID=116970 RepID=A0A9W9JZN8_9EURO|nr:hypothetical protein N7456_011425 [Penicillium angulare]